MSKIIEYAVGDIVVFKQLIGHYGRGKGCVRGPSIRHFIGQMGQVTRISPGAILYPYTVSMTRTTKNGNKITKSYRLMASEMEPLFTL